jgi:hypothetical protein
LVILLIASTSALASLPGVFDMNFACCSCELATAVSMLANSRWYLASSAIICPHVFCSAVAPAPPVPLLGSVAALVPSVLLLSVVVLVLVVVLFLCLSPPAHAVSDRTQTATATLNRLMRFSL